MPLSQEQTEVLSIMEDNTHVLFTSEFVDRVGTAFNVKLKSHRYEADPANPKGLTLENGAKESEPGRACFDLAPALCRTLDIAYPSTLGRGFQVRACVDAIRKHYE